MDSFHSASSGAWSYRTNVVRPNMYTPARFGNLGAKFNKKTMKLYALKGTKVTAGFVAVGLLMYGSSKLYDYIIYGSPESSESFLNSTFMQVAEFYKDFVVNNNETTEIIKLLDEVAKKTAISLDDLRRTIFDTKTREFTSENGDFDVPKFINYLVTVTNSLLKKLTDEGLVIYEKANSNSTERPNAFDFFTGEPIKCNPRNRTGIEDNSNSNNNSSWPTITIAVVAVAVLIVLVLKTFLKARSRAQEAQAGVSRARSFESFFTLSR